MDYEISFDKNNANCIIIKQGEKIINYIAAPPIESGCDIINFGQNLNSSYIYDFDGLVIITTKEKRQIYHKGNLIAETQRKQWKKK